MLLKKLYITLCAFILALASFATTTYAWFFLAQDVTVGNLAMTISNDKFLELSLDGVNYSDSITADQLKYTIGDALDFTNVTTLNGKDFFSSYMHSTVPRKNIDYISFDVWFRVQDDYYDGVYLYNNISRYYNYEIATSEKLDGTFVFSEGINYQTTVTFKYSETEIREKNSVNKYYAADAIRIGITEKNVDAVELVNQDLRTENDLAGFIYDPSENEERGFGKPFGGFDMYSIKTNQVLVAPEAPETKTNLTALKYNYYAIDNTSLVASFQEGADGKYYAKANVKIWLEGWDPDCLDAIYLDKIVMQLQFKCAIKPKAQTN